MLFFYLSALESAEDKMLFSSIYERYHSRMEQIAIRYLQNQHDAEDAVQNSFMQVIRHFEKIYSIPCAELPFWLISIVKNESFMILRKRKNELPLDSLETIPTIAEASTGYHELVAAIRALPDTYRAVLEMKLLLGYTDKEIAQHLNISETAVSSRASRGREVLRKMVTEEEKL